MLRRSAPVSRDPAASDDEAGCRPNGTHALLLEASLLDEAPARAAFRAWRTRVKIERLDRASLRLIPQLYRNLRRHGIEDPALDTWRGLYRYAWSRNQLLLHALGDVLGALHAAGIPTLVLKGAALALLHYRDVGARPMDDVDVLVPHDRAREAIAVLVARGWVACLDGPPASHVGYRHAVGFRNPAGRELDLHWNVLLECCAPEADVPCWRTAVPLAVAGHATRALGPADQLLHVCVHGAVWSPLPPIRWIADATLVVRTSGATLDWDHLVAEAGRRRVALAVERALAYLAARFAVPVPPGVLARLRAAPRWRLERVEYRVKARARAPRMLGDLPVLGCHVLRLTRGVTPSRRLAVVADYLRYRWGLDRTSQLPLHALAKATRRLVHVPLGRVARLAGGEERAP